MLVEFKIVCETWIKEEDEKVLKVLQLSDRWLSVEELSQQTGLPPQRVAQTLRLLKQQQSLYEARKKLSSEEA